jgi:hypothetical protein
MQHDDLVIIAELWGPHNTCLAVWHHTSGQRFWSQDSGNVFENDFFTSPDHTSLNTLDMVQLQKAVKAFDASDEEKQKFLAQLN